MEDAFGNIRFLKSQGRGLAIPNASNEGRRRPWLRGYETEGVGNEGSWLGVGSIAAPTMASSGTTGGYSCNGVMVWSKAVEIGPGAARIGCVLGVVHGSCASASNPIAWSILGVVRAMSSLAGDGRSRSAMPCCGSSILDNDIDERGVIGAPIELL